MSSINPPLLGYVIVSPCEHREHVTGDFTKEEYLRLQSLLYEVGEAVRRTVDPERLYLLSLGSQQGNSHVHWHVAPLPPDVPYEKQQTAAISTEDGILDLEETELEQLAASIRANLRI